MAFTWNRYYPNSRKLESNNILNGMAPRAAHREWVLADELPFLDFTDKGLVLEGLLSVAEQIRLAENY